MLTVTQSLPVHDQKCLIKVGVALCLCSDIFYNWYDAVWAMKKLEKHDC
jgi:hypothetical protein